MKKKNTIITGSSGNLGRAVVNHFANAGYAVQATVEPGQPYDFGLPDTTVYEVDLLDELRAAEFVDRAAMKHGNPDVAILLAGGYAGGDIASTDNASLKKMLALNFETAYNIARPAFMKMAAHGGGRIVLVSARAALEPRAGKHSLAYSLSKALLVNLAALLNEEGAATNVVTTVIAPSTIDTPANREQMPDADFSKWVSPATIAAIVDFITSPAAHPVVSPVLKIYGNPA